MFKKSGIPCQKVNLGYFYLFIFLFKTYMYLLWVLTIYVLSKIIKKYLFFFKQKISIKQQNNLSILRGRVFLMRCSPFETFSRAEDKHKVYNKADIDCFH